MAESSERTQIDHRLIRRLADILNETSLSEIEIEAGDLRIRVARTLQGAPAAATVQYQALPAPAPAAPASPSPGSTAPSGASESASPAAPQGEIVKSPMVGTAFLQPSPGSDSFIKPGAKVKAGQTMLIIEAMKTMNPIPAPRDGTVLEILVNDAEPVEFGEPLVVLE